MFKDLTILEVLVATFSIILNIFIQPCTYHCVFKYNQNKQLLKRIIYENKTIIEQKHF